MQFAQQRCASRAFFARIPVTGGGHERHHQRAYFYIGTFFEERRLVRTFGEEYRAYQRRVPRFLPRPRLRKKGRPRIGAAP